MSRSSTSSSDLTRFLRRLGVFAAPLALIAIVAEAPFLWLGEIWPARMVIAVQRHLAGDSVYARGDYFSQQLGVYKQAGIRSVRPAVLVAGSSRVLQMREEAFAPLRSFYNGGGMLQNAFDVARLAELLRDRHLPRPEVLVLGIDPWWLKQDMGARSWLDDPDQALDLTAHLSVFRALTRDRRWGELIDGLSLPVVHPTLSPLAIGYFARRSGNGFRRDGSRQYEPSIYAAFQADPRFIDREQPPVIDRIRSLRAQFALPAGVDRGRVEMIVEGVRRIVASGVEVQALLPPFSTESVEALAASAALGPLWRYYTTVLPGELERAGARVTSILSPATVGLSDVYMVDGFHAGEVLMTVIARRIAGEGSAALREVDVAALDRIIGAAETTLTLRRVPAPR